MKIGLCLPYMERDYDRNTTLDWCRGIEAGPFSTLSCGERVTSYSQHMTVLVSAAAALTERVRIVPSLYVLPMRSAVFTAKEIATLDVLSNGRITPVLGIGGREWDYRAVGASFERRHQRLDDQVAEMRRVWRGESTLEGVDPVGPPPVQKGGPPLLAGAMGPKAMARAARWADGIYGFSMNAASEPVKASFAMADAAWEAADREARPRRVTGFWYSLADDADAKLKAYVHEYVKFAGERAAKALAQTMVASRPDVIEQSMDAIEELGCDELVLVPATCEIAEVERLSELVTRRG